MCVRVLGFTEFQSRTERVHHRLQKISSPPLTAENEGGREMVEEEEGLGGGLIGLREKKEWGGGGELGWNVR